MRKETGLRLGPAAVLLFMILLAAGCNNTTPVPIQTESTGRTPSPASQSPPVTPTPSPEPAGATITIARGTQGGIGSFYIGLRDTGRSDYVDGNGVKQNGLVAGLSVYDTRDKSATNMKVYLGQSFEFHDYTFIVKEIKATHLYPWDPPGATGGGSIRLVVVTPSTGQDIGQKYLFVEEWLEIQESPKGDT